MFLTGIRICCLRNSPKKYRDDVSFRLRKITSLVRSIDRRMNSILRDRFLDDYEKCK